MTGLAINPTAGDSTDAATVARVIHPQNEDAPARRNTSPSQQTN